MEIETKLTVEDLASKFVNCKMNCDIEHNPTKILRLLGKNLNDITSLRNFFIEEKERMLKESKYEFANYYDSNIIIYLDTLIEEVTNAKLSSTETENAVIGAFIVGALKAGYAFKGFKWDNYSILVKADLFTLFPEFDTNFRGDIVACHKIGGKYVVIETERHPFDHTKQKEKTREPKEKQFYSTEIRHDRLCLTSAVFNTFEAALFHTMCPNQYSAMNILFESQKD